MLAYLQDYPLTQRELEEAMSILRGEGQPAALLYSHEAVRQRRRYDYLHAQAPRLLQEMVRGRYLQPAETQELVAASLKAAGELFDALEGPAEA